LGGGDQREIHEVSAARHTMTLAPPADMASYPGRGCRLHPVKRAIGG
jgi:hypothetical protein